MRDPSSHPVFLFESYRGIPLVSIIVSLRTGSAHDDPAQEGLARMTARLVRRGTKRRSRTQFDEALEAFGSELSLDVGASTTSFGIQVLAKHASAMVDLLVEMFAEPALEEAEQERLRRETTAELLEVRDKDRALAQIALRRALFQGHVYGRSSSGRLSTVQHLTVADVRAFHTQHYVRGGVIVGIAGDIDEVEAARLAARIEGAFPERPASPPVIPPPPGIKGRRVVLVDKADRTQSQLAIASLGTWAHDPDHAALGAAVSILGGTFTSRLMNEVRSKRGWSYSTSARASVAEQRHAFSMWAFPAAKDTAPCLELELELLAAFVNEGITEDELAFIKKYLVRSFAFEIDTAQKRLGHRLDIELLGLPADFYSGYQGHIEAITVAEANAAIAKRLTTEDLVIVVVGTAADLEADLRKTPRVDSFEVVPFDRD